MKTPKKSRIIQGDSLETLQQFPDDFFSSLVTDPPYALGKTGFMGKQWDAFQDRQAFVDKLKPIFQEALRVCKDGAHGLVFGGSRTHHYTACCLEEAGWEIIDCVLWLYGSGFPKSHSPWNNKYKKDLEKQLKEQGVEGDIVWK